jgi:DNA-binding transcriptional regulator YiaG
MPETTYNINHVIKPIRESLGLSQQQLADELGVHFLTVSAWERGRQVAPRYVELALCEIERRQILAEKKSVR